MTNEAQPSVLNKHRISADVAATYIGRGSKWGNPFRIGPDGDRAAVIAKHGHWLRDQHNLLRQIGELRGRHLVCFCAPAACHGDLLLRLANGSRTDLIAWWRAAPCDRSGEADETRRGSAEGESAVTGAARQAPSDNPLTETKEGSEHV